MPPRPIARSVARFMMRCPVPDSERRPNGFTLIEVMVVIAILGLLAALIVPNVTHSHETAMQKKAEVDLHSIADAVRMYWIENHHLPTWTDLVTPDAHGHPRLEDVRDPWDHAYVLAAGPTPSTMEIRCLGPDGVEGTEDDLVAQAR